MTRTFKTGKTVFAAWYSEWNAGTYLRTEPFCERPCIMDAGSTAGAPVLLSDGLLVGLTAGCAEAVFRWDGATVTVDAPEQHLFISTADDEKERWAQYHRAADVTMRKAPFGLLPEYCTWVEQNWLFKHRNLSSVKAALTHGMIREYLDTIDHCGWPAGRFTIDEGWCPREGPGGFGDWIPRDDLSLPFLAEAIRAAGHIPGLWIAPALIDRNSTAAVRNPNLVGTAVQMGGECDWSRYFYLNPSAASQELINDLFRRAYDWGFRKFKLDIFYGPKPVMQELSRQCRIAADALPEPVELEGHIPDPFCAQYMDVIRLNDILISDQHSGWEAVFADHLRVCRDSAPGMILNLDHIGGNAVDVSEGQFIRHLDLMADELHHGYPAVSLLPQHLGGRAVKAASQLLNKAGGQEERGGRAVLVEGRS